jgi:hypothetical protein
VTGGDASERSPEVQGTVGPLPPARDPKGRGVQLDPGSPYEGLAVTVHNDRYLRATFRDHPTADSRHRILLHRAVLFDAIGAGPHACHWCKYDGLEWGLEPDDVARLIVDHLDGDGFNNRMSNLLPVHKWCNDNRSIIEAKGIPWSTFYDVPPADRPPLRNTYNGTATPAAHDLARPRPAPTSARAAKTAVPLRDGFVDWAGLFVVPTNLLDHYPQLHRLVIP